MVRTVARTTSMWTSAWLGREATYMYQMRTLQTGNREIESPCGQTGAKQKQQTFNQGVKKMPENKKSFKLFFDQYEPTRNLPDEYKARLWDAVFQFNMGEEVKFDDPLLDALFSFFRRQFLLNDEAYKAKCKKNSENGSKGGRPRKNDNNNPEKPKETQNNPEKANGFFESEKKPQKADNDNDNVINPPISPLGGQGHSNRDDVPNSNSVANSDSDGGAVAQTGNKTDGVFVPPTEAQVAAYVRENNLDIDPAEFIAANERRGWTLKNGKPIERWKSVLQTWRRKREADNIPSDDSLFEAVWNAYPRKENKSAALKAFKDAQKKGLLPDDIVSRIELRRLSDDWQKANGNYVPQLEKWLNNGGWNDAGCEIHDSLSEGWEEDLDRLYEIYKRCDIGLFDSEEVKRQKEEIYRREYEPLLDDLHRRGCRCV